MLVVLDTNILVSALWSKDGSPARVVSMMLADIITPCYDYRILSEYSEVLKRPKFGFSEGEIDALLGYIEIYGLSVVAQPVSERFVDEADRKFYEIAKYSNAILLTGNLKHFPKDSLVMSVQKFLGIFC